MALETKKVEVKTVQFDVAEASKLLAIAGAVVGFPKYAGIAEAANRMLQKIEAELEEKLVKVHEEEAKAVAEAEAKKAAEAKAEADKAAKEAQAKGKAA